MIHGIPNISIPAVSYTTPQAGKMALPVAPASLIYSHFEYVSGIPAPEGTQGVAISKLNLLDVLIGQINQIKKGDRTPAPASTLPPGQTDTRRLDTLLDSMIENYKKEIKQAKDASAAMPYIPSPSAQTGAVFSLYS